MRDSTMWPLWMLSMIWVRKEKEDNKKKRGWGEIADCRRVARNEEQLPFWRECYLFFIRQFCLDLTYNLLYLFFYLSSLLHSGHNTIETKR